MLTQDWGLSKMMEVIADCSLRTPPFLKSFPGKEEETKEHCHPKVGHMYYIIFSKIRSIATLCKSTLILAWWHFPWQTITSTLHLCLVLSLLAPALLKQRGIPRPAYKQLHLFFSFQPTFVNAEILEISDLKQGPFFSTPVLPNPAPPGTLPCMFQMSHLIPIDGWITSFY